MAPFHKKINYHDFRNEYSIPASSARGIIKDLGLSIVNEGSETYITGESVLHNDIEYLLKHAVLEWRATMDIKNTLNGNFLEFAIVGDKLEGLVGISTITESMIQPKTPSQKKTPNKPSGNIILKPSDKVESHIIPINTETAGQGDAVYALVSALQSLQASNQEQDILKPQKALLEASEAGFHLNTEQLSALLGLSRQTIASKKTGFIKLGFSYEKIKEGSATLWKVHRIT